MNRLYRLSSVALIALPTAGLAAAPTPHVRGTVSAVSESSLTVHTDDGQDVTLALTSATHYVTATKSSLSAIDKDTFIGTATKDVGSKMVALEVVVFPNSMRGTGEGHYGWDPLPDSTLAGGGKVASTMTNGTVSAASSGTAAKVDTTMTNGTVSGDKSSGGVKELTVTYKGGEQHILVPPTTPIVLLAPGKMSDVSKGDGVVITEAKDASSLTAAAVVVGVNGVKPPM